MPLVPTDEFRVLSEPYHVELRCWSFSVALSEPALLGRAWQVDRMVDQFVDSPSEPRPVSPPGSSQVGGARAPCCAWA